MSSHTETAPANIPDTLRQPPREFSVAPFWFWNDELDADELRRQIADFEAHGVYGFVIHPRVGLPRHQGWMSENLLHLYGVALAEAKRRGMHVWLYDEGMYPSGSASGQVVAENPAWAARCLVPIELERDTPPELPDDHHLVALLPRAVGGFVAIVDRPANSHIRGLHFLDEAGTREDEPPAADLLNPDATAAFRRLVYDRFAQHFRPYFGDTVRGIFTDEPNPVGRGPVASSIVGGASTLPHVSEKLGYDFIPHLPALWYEDEPDSARYRADYHWAIHQRICETHFRPLYEWCEAHAIALTGHPSAGNDIGSQRWFHVPGQDTVWRYVEPGPTAVEGEQSTQAKVTSSAARHGRRRHNANECCGAYGHELTWQEMVWLADWCFVRGVTLLFPHAFYYSVRGPRRDERPPDVGPHSAWWDRYKTYADYCRRMGWLNTDSDHVCRIAVLAPPNNAPWRAAKVLQQHQLDFNYLDSDDLAGDATVDADGVRIADMHYDALILDGPLAPRTHTPALEPLRNTGRLLAWCPDNAPPAIDFAQPCANEASLVHALDAKTPRDVTCTPAVPDLRVRHVVKEGAHHYIFFNEGTAPLRTAIDVAATGQRCWLDLFGEDVRQLDNDNTLALEPYTTRILRIVP